MDSSSKKIIFLILGFFLFLFLFKFLFLSVPKNFSINQIIQIEKGSSLRFISGKLKDQNIIRSRFVFETLIILAGGEKKIPPGFYSFPEKMDVFKLSNYLVGELRSVKIKVTIPEGFDNEQIAEIFSSKLKNFNKELFLDQAKEKEGYLFPDTYFFLNTDNEKDVFKYLSDNFIKKTKNILNNISNYKDIITMASIIEREAKGDSDRALISGILWNRISKKMPLQVDAFPDTYKTRGLPQKPICNPGLKAIEASLHPVKSNYLYYLHDKTGQIYFAKTFEEHKNNIRKYLK